MVDSARKYLLSYSTLFTEVKNHQTESHIFHVQLDASGDTQPPVKLVKKSNVPSPPKGKQGFEEHKFHRGHQTHKEMSVLKLAGVECLLLL